MLSRTASNLFWTGRYIERADFVARLVEATARLASLPSTYGGDPTAWTGALAAAGAAAAFAKTGAEPTDIAIAPFLTVDPASPSSIHSCLELARNNARAVRTALTREVWEALNGAWHEVERFAGPRLSRVRLDDLLETVHRAVLAFEGAAHRTMLRDDAYWFLQLGSAMERADNTARLLDVKYHLLLPRDELVGGSLDHFQWVTILRTVSANTAYRWVYRDTVKPWLVADLLIFNTQMPRSLASCYEEIDGLLDRLGKGSGRRGPAHRTASAMLLGLRNTDIDAVFASGLHEFIGRFLADNNRLGAAVAEQFLF
ncbi:MAG: alpha-E domain-containing protein [Phenylobacterium sp.]|nr:MAG: alpha-E domain-containing protein [Phenylobacterium sp.]